MIEGRPDISNLSREDIAKAQTEAETVNAELDLLRETFTNPELDVLTNTQLAELIMLNRQEYAAKYFSDHPGAMDKIISTYKRVIPESNLTIYCDPEITDIDSDPKKVAFFEYLKSDQLDKDLDIINTWLPSSYSRTSRDQIPPVCFHSERSAKNLGMGDSIKAFVRGSRGTDKTVQMIDNRVGYRHSFVHEVTHGAEWVLTDALIAFQEGMARLSKYKIDETQNPHRDFVVSYREILKQNVPHPITQCQDSTGHFKLTLPDIIDAPGYQQYPTGLQQNVKDAWETAENIRKYNLCASFLGWYEANIDPSLSMFEKTSPNYKAIKRIILSLHPVKVEKNSPDILPNGKTISLPPTITSTLPEEYKILTTLQAKLVLPENTPYLTQIIQDLEEKCPGLCAHEPPDIYNGNPIEDDYSPDPGEAAYANQVISDLCNYIQARKVQTEKRYNQYLDFVVQEVVQPDEIHTENYTRGDI